MQIPQRSSQDASESTTPSGVVFAGDDGAAVAVAPGSLDGMPPSADS